MMQSDQLLAETDKEQLKEVGKHTYMLWKGLTDEGWPKLYATIYVATYVVALGWKDDTGDSV